MQSIHSHKLYQSLLNLLILTLPPLFWAGNFVLGRAVRGDIPPVTLSFIRWSIAIVILLPFAWRPLKQDMTLYWQYRWKILGVALLGAAAFNSLVYIGLKTTTATNGVLINSFCPMLIVLLGIIFYHQSISLLRSIGLLVSFIGVAFIVLKGDWHNLLVLNFNKGDLIIFIAVICWSIYTHWIKTLPAQMNKIGLTALQFIIAALVLFPFFLMEYFSGQHIIWSVFSASVIFYVGIFPSVIAFLLYTLAVSRAGPAKTGFFLNLMPVFGAILASIFLQEKLYNYHYIGITCIFIGIALSSYQKNVIIK